MSPGGGVPDRRSGTSALIVGAAVIAVCVVVLVLLTSIAPGIVVPVIVADVLLVAGMIAARLLVRPIVRRQWTITVLLLVACVLSLGAVVLVIALPRA